MFLDSYCTVRGYPPPSLLCPSLSFSFSFYHHYQPHAGVVLHLLLFLLYLQLNLRMKTWSLTDFWQSPASCAEEHSLALGTCPTAGALLGEWLCSCVSRGSRLKSNTVFLLLRGYDLPPAFLSSGEKKGGITAKVSNTRHGRWL